MQTSFHTKKRKEKSTNILLFFVLCYLWLPHLCLIGCLNTPSIELQILMLNKEASDSFLFPRAGLLN